MSQHKATISQILGSCVSMDNGYEHDNVWANSSQTVHFSHCLHQQCYLSNQSYDLLHHFIGKFTYPGPAIKYYHKTSNSPLIPPMTLALDVSSSRGAFVYFCRDSIHPAQSREFWRQRWVNGTNVVLISKATAPANRFLLSFCKI